MAGVLKAEGQRRTGVGEERGGKGRSQQLARNELQALPRSLGQVLLSFLSPSVFFHLSTSVVVPSKVLPALAA